MNDRPREGDRSGQARHAGRAAGAVAERVLLLDRPRFVRHVPDCLDPDHGGLVLCGDGAADRTLELTAGGYGGVLLEDTAAYERQVATAKAPFALPEGDLLFGNDLDSVLQAQLDRGATAALTPTRYVPAGASDALKAIADTAQRLDRDDVIVTLPVSIAWLRPGARAQLLSVIRDIPHPVALALGAQYDPLTAFAAAPEQLRNLLQEVPGVGLWRTDLAGFDALAHGGSFAAIGAGGSVRHLVPAEERPESSKPFPHYPSVLVPELLRFSTADFLAEAYAGVTPPRCQCRRCDGRFLDFFSRTGATRAAAHAHNAATWNGWLRDLFGHRRPGDRQAWWRARCRAAVDAHLTENVRIRQPGRFKPPAALRKWASLPPNGAVSAHGRAT